MGYSEEFVGKAVVDTNMSSDIIVTLMSFLPLPAITNFLTNGSSL